MQDPKHPKPDFASFSFSSKLWKYKPKNKSDKSSWFFVSVPKKISSKVQNLTSEKPRRGFGAIKIVVTVGHSRWGTSMFPDKEAGTYILPMKASIRKDENILEGDKVDVMIEIVGVK